MTLVTLPYRTQLAAGQPEDISMVLADMDAILAVLNGDIRNDNIATAAAILATKLNHPSDTQKLLRGDGTWGYLKSRCAFAANRTSGTLSIPASTWTKLVFNNQLFDGDNAFDSTQCIYTPPTAGYYLIGGSASLPGEADKQFYLGVSKNGTGSEVFEVSLNWSDSSDENTLNVVGLVEANGTDAFRLDAWHNCTTSKTMTYNDVDSRFWGFLVGLV